MKVTGQVNANDIGFLQMQTSDEDTRFGQRRQFISEDFTVVRARRQVFTQSYLGMIYTRRAERETGAPDLHTGGVDFAFNSSKFRGDQNLNLWGFWAWNNTPNQPTDRLGGHALGLRLDYPNEIWVSRVSYRVWGENHDPAIGFTPRSNVQRLSPQLNYLPRLANHRWIRRFSFGWDGEWVAGLDNVIQTALQNYNLFGIDLHSGDSFDFWIVPNFERLIDDFEIHPGIVLPEGTQSHFTRYRFQLTTGSQRPIAFRSTYDRGAFFSGDRREFVAAVDLRPRNGLRLSVDGEWNRIDLSEGAFSTSVIRAAAQTQFSPWVSLSNTVQYDTVSRMLGWQTRFRWILRPGNDFFFTYLQNWQDDFLALRTMDRQGSVKLSYTHRF